MGDTKEIQFTAGYIEEILHRFQSFFQYTPNVIFTFDLTGHIIDGNPFTEQLTGYDINELINTSIELLVHPDYREKTFTQLSIASQGEVQQCDIRIADKHGRLIDIHFITIPMIVHDNVVGIYGILIDISERKKIEKTLRDTKEMLESLFNGSVDALHITNMQGLLMQVNPTFETMFGWKANEVINKQLPIVPPHLRNEMEHVNKLLLHNESVTHFETKFLKKDNSLIDVSVSFSPIHDAEGNPVAIAAITRDISDRKQAEKYIQESEARYRLIADNSSDLIKSIDTDGIVTYASPSHKTILGFEPNELTGKFFGDYTHPDDVEIIIQKFEDAKKYHHNFSVEFRRLHQNGEWVWIEAKATSIYDQKGNLNQIIVVGRDIRERKHYESQLKQLAFYDPLTGIPNRRLLHDRLSQSIAQAKRSNQLLGLMYLDFDYFKWVNDTLGHNVGDELLKEFVSRIKGCLREVDTIGRLGGDEFAILLPQIHSKSDVEKIAIRILNALQKSWKINGHEFVITSSIGIAIYPTDSEDEETLFTYSDQALYQAKSQGRNKYRFFKSDNNLDRYRSIILENSLPSGLENDEFFLCYQPQIDFKTNQIIGSEALLRWQHPELGLISPVEFIPIAEKTGFIVELTNWVLFTACSQNKTWQDLGLPAEKIAVNISASYFQQQDLAEIVSQILDQIGLAPQYLELEITESTIMQNIETVVFALKRLKDMGVQVAIDDFGTGYSSLSYLKQLPVDVLKVDKSFIDEVETDLRNAKLLKAIINIAKAFDMKVVAEGVEVPEQHQILTDNDCDIGQGYLFSKPLPSKEYQSWLNQLNILH